MRKKRLKDVFKDHKLMTVMECIDHNNWKTEYRKEEKKGTGKITCDCGGTVKCGGWVGVEHAFCQDCGKGIQDLTGFLIGGNSWGTHIDYDKVSMPRDGRRWIVIKKEVSVDQ